jgi:hypothetical protein
VVTLQVSNPAGLAVFDQEVSDMSSPLYAHFLTLAGFTSLFAPPASAQDSVASWLSQNGLQVESTSPDHLTIVASGTLSQLSKALGVSFATYMNAAGQRFWAPVGTPALPAAIAPWILGIAGLDNLPTTFHTDFDLSPSASSQSPASIRPLTTGTGVLDTPTEMHQIYQLDQMYNATGNATHGVAPSYAVGLKLAETLWATGTDCGYSTTDMNEFFNLTDGYASVFPKPVITPHYTVTGYHVTTPPGTGACGDDELTLDMQYSGTDAPGANLNPTWVNAASNAALEELLSWLLTNVPNLDVITQSWGGNDVNMTAGSFEATYEQDYAQATSMGISIFASSADGDGSLTGTSCAARGHAGLEYPASSKYVLAVGGTSNNLTGSNTYADNVGSDVWNWCGAGIGGLAGSQGGVSLAFPKPSYMSGYAVTSSMTNAITVTKASGGSTWSATSARPDPDWSGPAACLNAWLNGGWAMTTQCSTTAYFGGTSFSSPATAGLTGSMDVFLGHKLGQVGPAFYSLMYQYLYQRPNNLLLPVYFVENGSNAFFKGATLYNESAGYGIPMAYNLSLDLGKPFIATNPLPGATAGTNYPITATVKDIQNVNYVNVSYLPPGGTWQNMTLTMTSGTANNGVWTGNIPGTSLTTAGSLKYCVWSTDKNQGNSWSPYNQSAWAATGSLSNTFGCTTPFVTYVNVPFAISTLTLNRSASGETTYAVAINSTFGGGVAPYYANWTWGDGSKGSLNGISTTTLPAPVGTHKYASPGTYLVTLWINTSNNARSTSKTLTVTVYAHLSISAIVPSSYSLWTPPANRTFSATPSNGLGPYTYAWNFNNGNTSTVASPPYQIYYTPGTYTVTLTVTDSLGIKAGASYAFRVWGTASTINLLKGQNFIALPTVANSYTLYEISVLAGGAFVGENLLSGSTSTLYDRGADAANGNVAFAGGNALWLNVSTAETITVYGNTTASLAAEPFVAGWSAIGWTVSASTLASQLAALINGATEVSIYSTSTGQWATFIVGWDTAAGPHDFTIATGTSVLVYTFGAGTFTE